MALKKEKYYGRQTKLALTHFAIGEEKMPSGVLKAQAVIKKAAAKTNMRLGVLDAKRGRAIEKAAQEIIDGKFPNEFPLSLWMSGSGTQFNMNVNEVIASRANQILTLRINPSSPIHPNDHVNKSQSTNDTVPTAIHIAAVSAVEGGLLPVLSVLTQTLEKKSRSFRGIKKVGRTHLQDAVTLSLGQEFSGYTDQLRTASKRVLHATKGLYEVPIGGTAVGTGLNTPQGYRKKVIAEINRITGLSMKPAHNLFAAMAAHDALVTFSSSLEGLALSLMKIANDIRWMGSGPNAGLGELLLPENEPGSSIMPGKVNPTQCEALMMVCARVIGNHAAVVHGSAGLSNFELQVAKPLLAHAILNSVRLLSDSTRSFERYGVRGIKANAPRLKETAGSSLFEATKLSQDIGYDKAAEMVKMSRRANFPKGHRKRR